MKTKIFILAFVAFLPVVASAQWPVWPKGASVADKYTASGYGDANALATAAGIKNVVIDKVLPIYTDVEFLGPVEFIGDGKLDLRTGATATLQAGSVIAPKNKQIFIDNGGDVRMPGAHIYSAWFGIFGDGTTEAGEPINWMAQSLRGESSANITWGTWGMIEFLDGTFVVNPDDHLMFLPDSGRTLWILGQGRSTKFRNDDFCSYGGVFGDFYEAGGNSAQGHVIFSDFEITETHQGDTDGTGGNNAFGIVFSQCTIERVYIRNAGNRAIAFEGHDLPYSGTGNGFQTIVIRDVVSENSWKNALSINRPDTARMLQVYVENFYVDGYSLITASNTSQNASGINVIGRAGYGTDRNTGFSLYLKDFTLKNGYACAIELNGMSSKNKVFLKDGRIENNDATYGTVPAAVDIVSAPEGVVDNVIIRNNTGSGWRHRSVLDANWSFTNSTIDSNSIYGLDLFGTTGYSFDNCRIRDNTTSQIYQSVSSRWPWARFSNSHVRGSSLLKYTSDYDPDDYWSNAGSTFELVRDFTVDGVDLLDNGYFAADSGRAKDINNDNVPDGWEIVVTEGYRDSVRVQFQPDSGLIVHNFSAANIVFFLRFYVGDRVLSGRTYTVEIYGMQWKTGSSGRAIYNAGADLGTFTTGLDSNTGVAVTSYVGFGRNVFNAGSRQLIRYIKCILEPE